MCQIHWELYDCGCIVILDRSLLCRAFQEVNPGYSEMQDLVRQRQGSHVCIGACFGIEIFWRQVHQHCSCCCSSDCCFGLYIWRIREHRQAEQARHLAHQEYNRQKTEIVRTSIRMRQDAYRSMQRNYQILVLLVLRPKTPADFYRVWLVLNQAARRSFSENQIIGPTLNTLQQAMDMQYPHMDRRLSALYLQSVDRYWRRFYMLELHKALRADVCQRLARIRALSLEHGPDGETV